MQAMDDLTLLREYAANNSEPAFEVLVSRYVHLVHSAAMPQVRDPHLADEVTQAVFIILARKAGRLGSRTILAGCLFKTTRFVALAQIRGAARRRQHDREATMQSEHQLSTTDEPWEELSPMLDEALMKLGEKDRQAVILRYFEERNLAEVGRALGAGEDAARMRINRALEKLRKVLTKRGMKLTTTAIAGAVSANSIQAAPMELASSVTTVAIAGGSNATTSTLTLVKGTLKMMTWIKVRTAMGLAASVLLAAGISTVTVSTVLRAQETQAVQQQATPNADSLVGIGAMLRADGTYPRIVQIVKGGPADRDGRLKANDHIAAVAQGDAAFVDCANTGLREVVEMIRGKEGTTVRLQVIPAVAADPAQREVISLVRAKVMLPPAGSPDGDSP
jgi:RNA polymerase sigma factor (sigma-70 family)